MSKITQIHDALISFLGTTLPNHTRIPNPYLVEENPELSLIQGYGLKIGPATNSNRHVSCKMSVSRQVSIVLSRKFFAYELDASGKASTEKSLLEDLQLVLAPFEKKEVAENLVVKAQFQSDNGIEFIFSGDKPFYKIESTFEVEYFEDIT